MIELREYQIKAIEELKDKVFKLLESSGRGVCIFKAPTGSGKTLMVSEVIRKLALEPETANKLAYIWISVRKLHEQSKEKLDRYYENDRLVKCSYFEDLENKQIEEKEILFVNWESLNKKDKNLLIRENEQDNNLNNIVNNTKDDGRKIVLIIDESHYAAGSERSKELIDIINPKVTIEVSATPKLMENASLTLTTEIVNVTLDDVKSEEMIKQEIAINPEFLDIKVNNKTIDEVVLEQAIKKRVELLNAYKKESSNVNPLVLIQLPDQREELIDKKEEIISELKDKFNITEANGKLAIWLSEEKTSTLPNIEKNNNEVEVLIFKQAIALGWDCPRASILVIFREYKSFTFTIQTIGRIMRMPELKYYKFDILNKGYIFTNLAHIDLTKEYVKDYVTTNDSKRRNDLYTKLALKSFYLKRQRERTRLSSKFIKIFLGLAEKNNLKKKLTVHYSKIVDPVIAEGKLINIDREGEVKSKGHVNIELSEADVDKRFNDFVARNCYPFAPYDSSDRLKTALYTFLYSAFRFKKYSIKAQKIVLGKENVQLFIDIINLAKEEFKSKVTEELSEKREYQIENNWEVPYIVMYSKSYETLETKRAIMKPFYVRGASKPELSFIKKIDASNKIDWWYKNGENEVTYFAIPYNDNGMPRTFYPDFIIKFKNGKIGLFDTKSGITAEIAKPKADALQQYIAEENKKGKKLFGGIVIEHNGSWFYNDEKDYDYNPSDLSKWKMFEV